MDKNSKKNNTESFPKVGINWYPGHMAKTKKEIKEKLDLIDIVFELIDARIPLSSKNNDINNLIKNKPRILIMTKTDLCDINITNKWKKYYEEKGYKVILVDLINNKNINLILNITSDLSKEINIKRTTKGLKPRRIRVLILGIPNVGKSTLINRLVGRKATNTGNKPGITKKLEWIRINNNLELLDTPGILWPRLDNNTIALNLASMTAIKEEILNKEEVSIYIINKMIKLYKDNLIKRYKLNNIDDNYNVVDILDKIANKTGSIKNNETDYDKVYNIILKDLREGYLGSVTFDEYDN